VDDALADRLAIAELVRLERFYRDQGDWDALLACYTDDATVVTTWFDGGASDFVEASRGMAGRGRHSKHLITPTQIRVNGDRALVESYGEIHFRDVLDGVEVDMTMYCRFFSRVRRTEAGWKLASFEGIYQRDVIAPVDPAERLPIDWDELRRLRPSYRVWAWALTRRGYDVGEDRLGDDRPEQLAAFYEDAERWLTARRP
jgi:ketosteroid isomerase-like protein